jgi:hypothetical protein
VASPAGPAADDHHIVGVRAEARRYQSEGPREILLGGVLEHRAVGENGDGQVLRIRSEARQKGRGVPVLVGIDHPEGNGVPFEEVRQPGHVRRPHLPDQDGASEPDLDQGHATKNERAQDALAQLGLGHEQSSELLRRDQDRLDVADRTGVEHAQVRAPGELPDLGDHLARNHLRHLLERRPHQLRERGHRHRMAEAVARQDRNPAGEDHVHPGYGLSGPEQQLPCRKAPDLAETPDAVDLGRREDRKHLLEARGQGGVGGGRLVVAGHGEVRGCRGMQTPYARGGGRSTKERRVAEAGASEMTSRNRG